MNAVLIELVLGVRNLRRNVKRSLAALATVASGVVAFMLAVTYRLFVRVSLIAVSPIHTDFFFHRKTPGLRYFSVRMWWRLHRDFYSMA